MCSVVWPFGCCGSSLSVSVCETDCFCSLHCCCDVVVFVVLMMVCEEHIMRTREDDTKSLVILVQVSCASHTFHQLKFTPLLMALTCLHALCGSSCMLCSLNFTVSINSPTE